MFVCVSIGLRGMTQNQSESINGILWGRCPKTKFCGRQKVELAVSQTFCEFNTGAYSKVSLQVDCGLNVRSNIIASFSLQDKVRIEKAAMKILDRARLTRRKAEKAAMKILDRARLARRKAEKAAMKILDRAHLTRRKVEKAAMKILDRALLTRTNARAKKKSKNDKDNCNSYMAGRFGTSKTPEVLSVQPIQKTRATFSKKKVATKFIDERYIKIVIYSINNAVN